MHGENATADAESSDGVDPQLIDSLRTVLKAAREASRDALPAAEQLLVEARTAHAAVVEMLHGRIREFAVEKEALEAKIAELEGIVATSEQRKAKAEQDSLATAAVAASVRKQLDDALRERDTMGIQLDAALEEKARIDKALVARDALFQNERDAFLRQSQSLGVKLRDAQTQAEALLEEKKGLEAHQQDMEKEVQRLADELAQKTSLLDKKTREKDSALEKALLEKTTAEARLATLQQQWESLSR